MEEFMLDLFQLPTNRLLETKDFLWRAKILLEMLLAEEPFIAEGHVRIFLFVFEALEIEDVNCSSRILLLELHIIFDSSAQWTVHAGESELILVEVDGGSIVDAMEVDIILDAADLSGWDPAPAISEDCKLLARFNENKTPIALPRRVVDDLRNECPEIHNSIINMKVK